MIAVEQEPICIRLDIELCTHCTVNFSLSLCKPVLPVSCYSCTEQTWQIVEDTIHSIHLDQTEEQLYIIQ